MKWLIYTFMDFALFFVADGPTTATIMTNKRDYTTLVFGVMVVLTSLPLKARLGWVDQSNSGGKFA
jgi:hypothetical protein